MIYDGPPPSGHATVAINSMLSSAAVMLSIMPGHGPGDLVIAVPICASSVPLALYVGRIAATRSAFLARIIPAGVGSCALLFNIARHGGGTLIAFSVAICAVFLLTCSGKILHSRYGVPEDTDDPDDLRHKLTQAETRERELLDQIAQLQSAS